jgi:hypothetical protein
MMDKKERTSWSTDAKLEQAKDAALGAHSGRPSLADQVGEAAGGISGVLLGAGIGSAAGPIGTLLGGIAGAIGGWWTGRAISEAAEKLTVDDDRYYRAHYDASPTKLADGSFDDARAAYYLGDIASHNPNFTDRMFNEVEPELKRGWEQSGDRPYEWDAARPFANAGYTRGLERRSFTDRRIAMRFDEKERRVSTERRTCEPEETG